LEISELLASGENHGERREETEEIPTIDELRKRFARVELSIQKAFIYLAQHSTASFRLQYGINLKKFPGSFRVRLVCRIIPVAEKFTI
jgi:hypothetical protein